MVDKVHRVEAFVGVLDVGSLDLALMCWLTSPERSWGQAGCSNPRLALPWMRTLPMALPEQLGEGLDRDLVHKVAHA